MPILIIFLLLVFVFYPILKAHNTDNFNYNYEKLLDEIHEKGD